ncbi:MAG: hypothetical protein ABW217_20360 [Polyangiaceae bacterium]
MNSETPLVAATSPLLAHGGMAAVHELFFGGASLRVVCATPALAQHVARELGLLPCTGSGVTPAQAVLGACELVLERSLALPPLVADDVAERSLEWSWQGSECRLETASTFAQLHVAADGSCSGRAALALRRGALDALLSGVVAALLYRRGGAVLHAAAIEIDGGALAFIGPSGSGKSTAARLSGAPLFAVDRLALLAPSELGGRWLACALPGGTSEPGHGARSHELVLPLCAVLRVGPKSSPLALALLAGARSLAQLRAAMFQGSRLPEDERLLLDCASALLRAVPVAKVSFSLESQLAPLLDSWLSATEAAR